MGDSKPTPRPGPQPSFLASPGEGPHSAEMHQGRIAGPKSGTLVRQGARGQARARWGRGGCRRPIEAPPCRSGRPGAHLGRAPKPVRLMPCHRKSSNPKALRVTFQHRPSNTVRPTRANPQKTAILAPYRDPHRSRPARGRPTRPAIRARAKIAETFADPPPLHTAAGDIEDAARISGRQNIRLDDAERPIADPFRCRLQVQPRCNRSATSNPLIYMDIIRRLQGCRF